MRRQSLRFPRSDRCYTFLWLLPGLCRACTSLFICINALLYAEGSTLHALWYNHFFKNWGLFTASWESLGVKNPPANAGDLRDVGWMPGSGRCPEGGNGYPLQYSCLENPMDSRAWRATVHGVTKGRTQLSNTFTSSILQLVQEYY